MNTSDTITERPCRPGSEKGKIDVIVIGAGISGLTAAYRLHQAGASVQIIEAGSRPGGVVQSVEKDGFLIETGPNSFQSTGENIMALCRDLDLTPQPTAALAKKRYIYHSNQLLPLPSNPLQFLTTPLLSLIGKLRLLSEPFQPRYQGFEEETVAEFIRRRLGNEALDRLVNPFVSGVYAGNPEKLSAQSTFSALCKFEQEQGSIVKGALHTKKQKKKTQQGPRAPYQLLSFNGGLTQLPKALVQALPLGSCRYNTKVNAIQKTDEHYSILLSDGTQLDTAGVIIATPAQQAALLLQGIAPSAVKPLNEMAYPTLWVVHIGFYQKDIHHPLDGFGCLIPRKSGPTTLGSIWASSLFPQRAPEGQVLLTNFIGGGCHPEIADWDEEKVVQTVLKDLGTILELPDPPKPTFIHPIHYSQAIPQYTLGHRERIDTLHQALTGLPGIALAGNYLNGVSLNDTVKSGDFAAGILLQDLKALQK